MFRAASTALSPPYNPQRGQAGIGTGEQISGTPLAQPRAVARNYTSAAPTTGRSTWPVASPEDFQRGQPPAAGSAQRYAKGQAPLPPRDPSGTPDYVWYPYFSRGAAAYAPQFGKVLTNPIGAGIPVQRRPQSSYGMSGQYYDHTIFYSNQVISTQMNLTGLDTAQALAMNPLVNGNVIRAMVRVY